jgi:hypothetical protein
MFGNLVSTDMRLKMSIWQIKSPYAGFVIQSDLTTEELVICNGDGSGKLYKLSIDQLSDDCEPINSTYFTYGFTSSDKAAEFPLLGLHRKRFTMSQQLIVGSGTCTMAVYPNWFYTPSTLVFNTLAFSTPIVLQEQPVDDIIRPLNVGGNRAYVAYSTNAVGAAFNLSKLIMVGTMDPFASVNPNSG